MMRINLLPPSVLGQRQRSRRSRVCYALCATFVVLLSVWGWAGLEQFRKLTNEIEQARQKAQTAMETSKYLPTVQREIDELQAVLAVRRAVENPMPALGLLAVLSELAPETVALTSLSLDMPPVNLSATPAAARSNGAKAEADRPVRLELEGVALNSAELARLVRRLSNHQLFSSVALTRSRHQTIAGMERVTFHISVVMNGAPQPASGAQVAAAK